MVVSLRAGGRDAGGGGRGLHLRVSARVPRPHTPRTQKPEPQDGVGCLAVLMVSNDLTFGVNAYFK